MDTNRKTYQNLSSIGLVALAVVLSGALPVRAQNQPPRETAPPQQLQPPQPPDNAAPAPDQHQGDHDYGINHEELAAMDRFFDAHPEIAEQLRKDPSLIDNRRFINDHPALGEFLQSHPGVKEEFTEHPDAFMHAEERYDRREDDRRDDHITERQLAAMNAFFDKHPVLAEQLRKDPSLIDNKHWADDHPELQAFLRDHPEIREEFRQHPDAFMRAEDRYERQHQDAGNGRDNGRGWDRDSDRREMSGFGDFLRAHSSTASALSQDPTLANNREFLETHPELQGYLQAHPAVQQQLAQNPQAVMTSPAVGETTRPKAMTTPGKPDNMNPEPK